MRLEAELKLDSEEMQRIENTIRLILNLNRENQIRSEAYVAGLTAAQGNGNAQPMMVG